MDRYEAGMLARSKAGHDTGKVYVIACVDDAYVYLVDGLLRPLDNPKKKKKKKHVQPIHKIYDVTGADDVAIKRILKEYKEKDVNLEED